MPLPPRVSASSWKISKRFSMARSLLARSPAACDLCMFVNKYSRLGSVAGGVGFAGLRLRERWERRLRRRSDFSDPLSDQGSDKESSLSHSIASSWSCRIWRCSGDSIECDLFAFPFPLPTCDRRELNSASATAAASRRECLLAARLLPLPDLVPTDLFSLSPARRVHSMSSRSSRLALRRASRTPCC